MKKKILISLAAITAIATAVYFYPSGESKAVEELIKKGLDERVNSGDVTSYKSVTCTTNDNITCKIEQVVTPLQSQQQTKALSFDSVTIGHVKEYIHFASDDIALKEGEHKTLSVDMQNIELDNHPLLYDEAYMQELFKEDKEALSYINKHFNRPSSLYYTINLSKSGSQLHIKDHARFNVGPFSFSESASITSLANLNELRHTTEQNSMELLPKITIESVEFSIKNPKGFLLNFYYISYKNAHHSMASQFNTAEINRQFDIDSDKILNKKDFISFQQQFLLKQVDALIANDSFIQKRLNKNDQLRTKLHDIITMQSSAIDISITNVDHLSLADFTSVAMAYMISGKLPSRLNIDVNIK